MSEVMIDMDILNNDDVPPGLSLAFAQNIRGMNAFSNLDESSKSEFIEKAKGLKTEGEIQRLVRDLQEKSVYEEGMRFT